MWIIGIYWHFVCLEIRIQQINVWKIDETHKLQKYLFYVHKCYFDTEQTAFSCRDDVNINAVIIRGVLFYTWSHLPLYCFIIMCKADLYQILIPYNNSHKYKYMHLMYINHNIYLDSFKKKHITRLYRSNIRVLPETLFYFIILIGIRAQFYNPLECHFYGNIFPLDRFMCKYASVKCYK